MSGGMRLFLDTNVLLSAMLFPQGRAAAFLRRAITGHTIVLSAYVIEELYVVFARKFPAKVDALETFLAALPFEEVAAPHDRRMPHHPEPRDPKDAPVVDAAIRSSCDYLVTGDKDLHVLARDEHPKIITPGSFLTLDEESSELFE